MIDINTAEHSVLTRLLIGVQLHDGRYRGTGDHPPAPARLFQALVAGVGLGGPEELERAALALKWLEELAPPIVGCPVMTKGQRVVNYVPNNDLDAVDGDPRRIAEIRTDKVIHPWLFDGTLPLLYVWELCREEEDERMARAVCALSEQLYQLGRGDDMAWAWGEVLDEKEVDARLASYPGDVYQPSSGGSGRPLDCPKRGSLDSLTERYAAGSRRFRFVKQGRSIKQLFSQAPKPRFRPVAYDSPPSRRVFELRERTSEASYGRWPLARASKLVVFLRDGAVERLRGALPGQRAEIERMLVGRKANGADAGPISLRIRIVPLSSIGHPYADREIRRVLIEVPAGCPLRDDDVYWAFSGLELVDSVTGEVFDRVLTPSTDESMIIHYGVSDGAESRLWRTVTPAALPEVARRRRIDPAQVATQAKGGAERAAEQARAAGAIIQALHHAEIRTRAEAIRVQREPFEAKGERVEAFAAGTRFSKDRLWHAEIAFAAKVAGPLVIGDGRFLGLGVMAPVRSLEARMRLTPCQEKRS